MPRSAQRRERMHDADKEGGERTSPDVELGLGFRVWGLGFRV